MTKDEINELPVQRYTGPRHWVRDEKALARAVETLSKEKLLGFDTETRPAFRRGQHFLPSLLQLGGQRAVYLFQLSELGLPRSLCALLRNPAIVKAGVAIGQDLNQLQELRPFKPGGFVDLSDMAREKGLKNYGLRGLTAVLLGFRISKQAQRSNWARPDLSDAQLTYAATDAWVSRKLYVKMQRLKSVEES
jgi:ribonuclease D